jgi:hypothetical protein
MRLIAKGLKIISRDGILVMKEVQPLYLAAAPPPGTADTLTMIIKRKS